MDYALVLYFDKATEDYFNGIIEAVAQGGGNTHIVDNKVPPHITIAHFNTDGVADVIDALDKRISSFSAGDVVWTSLGAFVPGVLFAAPVLNEYLQNACSSAVSMVTSYAQGGLNPYYLPHQWVPHTSLAVRLNEDNISAAFAVAARRFAAIGGKCERLALVEASPYKEMKIWDLALA